MQIPHIAIPVEETSVAYLAACRWPDGLPMLARYETAWLIFHKLRRWPAS